MGADGWGGVGGAWMGVGTTGDRAWERRGTFSLVSLVCSFWFVWFKFIGSSSSVLVDFFLLLA